VEDRQEEENGFLSGGSNLLSPLPLCHHRSCPRLDAAAAKWIRSGVGTWERRDKSMEKE
jgi:hypothetical protein